jgi:hypothetical protein
LIIDASLPIAFADFRCFRADIAAFFFFAADFLSFSLCFDAFRCRHCRFHLIAMPILAYADAMMPPLSFR